MTVVDVEAGHEVVGEIAFAGSVRPSALSLDGRLFQHVDGLNGFQVADVDRRKVVATVEHGTPLGWFFVYGRLGWLGPSGFQRCHGLAIRPDQQEIWSVCGASVTVHGITESSYPELARVPLESKGYWLTFSPDGRWALVALSGANQVAVVDAESRQIVAHLPAGTAPKRNLVIELDLGRGHRPRADAILTSMSDWGETSYQLARGVGLAAAVVLGLALERWRPHERLRPAWRTNLGLWAVDGARDGRGLWRLRLGRRRLGRRPAGSGCSRGWAPARGRPSAVGILGLDAVSYLWHRANHQVPLLWRFHQVHHADASFHVTTASALPPGRAPARAPGPARGHRAPRCAAGGCAALRARLRRREPSRARKLRSSPTPRPGRPARASSRPRFTADTTPPIGVSSNTNFGTVFSIWDRLARTFRIGEPHRRVVTGLPDRPPLETPGLTQSLLMPFARTRAR